jgi:hydrogenase maturation protease
MPDAPMLSPHELDPATVLRVAGALGGACKRVLLVACEPFDLGGEEGTMGLSAPVAAAVDRAVGLIEDLVNDLLGIRAAAGAPYAAGGLSPNPMERS